MDMMERGDISGSQLQFPSALSENSEKSGPREKSDVNSKAGSMVVIAGLI
jgi:hypothetical protein